MNPRELITNSLQQLNGAVVTLALALIMAMPACHAQAQLPPGMGFNQGLPGAVLNQQVQQFNLFKDQPYLKSPINPEGRNTFIPDEPEIIYDESLKRHTQIQGQIIAPEPIISAPEN